MLIAWNQRMAALPRVWGHRGHGANPRGFPASLGQAPAAAGRCISVPTPTILPVVPEDRTAGGLHYRGLCP